VAKIYQNPWVLDTICAHRSLLPFSTIDRRERTGGDALYARHSAGNHYAYGCFAAFLPQTLPQLKPAIGHGLEKS